MAHFKLYEVLCRDGSIIWLQENELIKDFPKVIGAGHKPDMRPMAGMKVVTLIPGDDKPKVLMNLDDTVYDASSRSSTVKGQVTSKKNQAIAIKEKPKKPHYEEVTDSSDDDSNQEQSFASDSPSSDDDSEKKHKKQGRGSSMFSLRL